MRSEPVIIELAECFDQLNALWKEAENSLRKVPLPVDASVPVGDGVFIGYVKLPGGWRVCYGSAEDWKPITDCSLDVRVASTAHLCKLREEVMRCAAEQVPKIKQAIIHLRETIEKW